MAKMCLRVTNFSCSLIVLSMLSTTFTIFNASKNLPNRSGLPAWAPHQQKWPQITLLVIACVSLAFSLMVFYAYWKGGHRRAEKAAIYYTVFSVVFFTFSIVMWAIGAAILNQSRNNGQGKDMWGWSCKDGKRKDVFSSDVDYALICRLQVRLPSPDTVEDRLTWVAELVFDLRFHRDHCGGHHHCHLRDRVLSLLQQTPASQVNECTRQGSERPLSCPAPDPVSAKYSRLQVSCLWQLPIPPPG